ncbi:mitotic fidelity of chromosome transmission- protein [Sorochytrium milnesiophthora]
MPATTPQFMKAAKAIIPDDVGYIGRRTGLIGKPLPEFVGPEDLEEYFKSSDEEEEPAKQTARKLDLGKRKKGPPAQPSPKRAKNSANKASAGRQSHYEIDLDTSADYGIVYLNEPETDASPPKAPTPKSRSSTTTRTEPSPKTSTQKSSSSAVALAIGASQEAEEEHEEEHDSFVTRPPRRKTTARAAESIALTPGRSLVAALTDDAANVDEDDEDDAVPAPTADTVVLAPTPVHQGETQPRTSARLLSSRKSNGNSNAADPSRLPPSPKQRPSRTPPRFAPEPSPAKTTSPAPRRTSPRRQPEQRPPSSQDMYPSSQASDITVDEERRPPLELLSQQSQSQDDAHGLVRDGRDGRTAIYRSYSPEPSPERSPVRPATKVYQARGTSSANQRARVSSPVAQRAAPQNAPSPRARSPVSSNSRSTRSSKISFSKISQQTHADNADDNIPDDPPSPPPVPYDAEDAVESFPVVAVRGRGGRARRSGGRLPSPSARSAAHHDAQDADPDDDDQDSEPEQPPAPSPAKKQPRKAAAASSSKGQPKTASKAAAAKAASKDTKKPAVAAKVKATSEPEEGSRSKGKAKQKQAPARKTVNASSDSDTDADPAKTPGGTEHIHLDPHDIQVGANGRPVRFRIKPLEYWRGETVEYKRVKLPNGGVANAIAEVIRKPSAGEQQRAAPARSRKRTTPLPATAPAVSKKLPKNFDQNVSGFMPYIRHDTHREADEEQCLVIGPHMIDTKPVNKAPYKFQKTFGEEDFFSSGIIEIDKGDEKPNRNSKDNCFMFYVLQGHVEVTIYQTSTVLIEGWQCFIPRDNQYSIRNVGDATARLLFASGKKE